MVKPLLLIVLSSIGAVTSNVLLRKTLEGRELFSRNPIELLRNFALLFKEPLIWFGGCSLAIATVFWILALSKIKISVAYPVQIGLAFVLTGVASYLIFHNQLSPKMVIGYLMILGGVTLVSL